MITAMLFAIIFVGISAGINAYVLYKVQERLDPQREVLIKTATGLWELQQRHEAARMDAMMARDNNGASA